MEVFGNEHYTIGIYSTAWALKALENFNRSNIFTVCVKYTVLDEKEQIARWMNYLIYCTRVTVDVLIRKIKKTIQAE